MGQKANPIANRLGLILGWKSIWIKNYSINVKEDEYIRNFINKRFYRKYCISNILIEKTRNKIIITIFTSKPAIVIGKQGKEVEYLKQVIRKKIDKINKNLNIYINVVDVVQPEIDALLVAKNICRQIINRVSYKKCIKLSILNAMRMKIKGIKIKISGRLNGVEMARKETYKEGIIKLSTFRSNIDYGFYEANTTYGKIGVKVWIMKNLLYSKMKDLTNFYNNFFKIRRRRNNKFLKKKIYAKKKIY
ncbi:MAG: 30S ribosomal protein S3 [Candidatus Shikimatogenerans bostrichidophilus]|nr:MAG: 30S ribosomal protein S3 [Candidatus Shikimatogenerans bostrichidophilus]